MASGDGFCLQTESYDGVKVVFTEAQRALKASTHPELRDPDFISGRLKRAINEPSFVYEDIGQPGVRHAFYLEEYAVNGVMRYTKAVVNIKVTPHFIVTAFRPNYVKERGKTEPIYGGNQ